MPREGCQNCGWKDCYRWLKLLVNLPKTGSEECYRCYVSQIKWVIYAWNIEVTWCSPCTIVARSLIFMHHFRSFKICFLSTDRECKGYFQSFLCTSLTTVVTIPIISFLYLLLTPLSCLPLVRVRLCCSAEKAIAKTDHLISLWIWSSGSCVGVLWERSVL